MEWGYEWGLSVIRAFQSNTHPLLVAAVKAVTCLGAPEAYLIVIPMIFWCLDAKKGIKLGMFSLLAVMLNIGIKQVLRVERPFVIDPTVALAYESGYSTPSAHAMGMAFIIPYSAFLFHWKKRIKIAASVLLPLLIGLTRIYLGVHYPSDVFSGWCCGYLFAAGVILFEKDAERLLAPLRSSLKILIAAVIVFFGIAWQKKMTLPAAMFFGLVCGYIVCMKKIHFDARRGTRMQKILRLLVGFACLAAAAAGQKFLCPQRTSDYYMIVRFVGAAAVGFAASCLAPAVFRLLKLY